MQAGDFSVRVDGDWEGVHGKLADAFNDIIIANERMASELERIGYGVGKQGRTRQRFSLGRRGGAWEKMEGSVNSLIEDLLWPTQEVTRTIAAVAKGDLSQTMSLEVEGRPLEGAFLRSATIVNTMIEQLSVFSSEVTRVAREVGTEGKLGGQAKVKGVSGVWHELTESVNQMASNLTGQVRNISEVTIAVANGDLSRKITVDVRGEILQLKETINTMVDQLRSFASEVTRVAREVGTDGKLGGQAVVPGVAGTWKDLTDSVNAMATNLTSQVRNIAEVTTAVARGDLSRKITVDVKGEIRALKDTINTMVDQLNGFSAEVTRVAREVGTEGKLGGQAQVAGVSGVWKELKDNINAMIGNLRVTTERNREQDWLKTNLAKFSGMMQGQRDLITLGQMLLSELAPLVNAQQGLIYVVDSERPDAPRLRKLAGYADAGGVESERGIIFGEGLIGQCAAQRELILLRDVTHEAVQVKSGLVSAKPRSVIVLPVLFEDDLKAVIELASLDDFTESQRVFLEQLTGSIGIVLNTIAATMRTESLLSQSQQLAGELQSQQAELQQTNEELALKAKLLAEQNAEVERKNQEIEHARRAVEEKAAELALTSRYKSEFLANMSHELRTPLNSILILGQQLADNHEENLNNRQVEFAKTIHAAGTDLLNLISDILDLSKIESGTVTVENEAIPFTHLHDSIERSFRHDAERRNLKFTVAFDDSLGRAINTDSKRLLQILKNLLSNAFKFTERGGVQLHARLATDGWSSDHPVLAKSPMVVAIEVRDTGIGISSEKQKIVFEAFQQADAGTARKYGGTGLGLAISRELAGVLGGEIRLESRPGDGSIFILYLPLTYTAPADRPAIHRLAAVEEVRSSAAPLLHLAQAMEDDRAILRPGELSLLIIEDDKHYAAVLRELARASGFRALVAERGAEGLRLAHDYQPSAITLDIFLPDMLGWTVLARLKQAPETRHIPVQIVTVEEERHHSMERGAFSYLAKPATTQSISAALERIKQYSVPRVKRLLVVEDDAIASRSIKELIRHEDVEISHAGTGDEALRQMRTGAFDCVVLDLRLPDMNGFELLDAVQGDSALHDLPIVVFTGKDLTPDEETRLLKVAKSIIIKGVQSPERLLDETALFLHRVIADLPAPKRDMLRALHQSDASLLGKKVLVVDDDVRNIFAISSILERHGMEVITANNGQEAIDRVEQEPAIAMVLMDIMMSGMDGYQTMRGIRSRPELRSLPIIALTAKAMKGDREKCIEAGASDYIAKPVHTDQLLALLRQWLHRPWQPSPPPSWSRFASCWWMTTLRACSVTGPSSIRWANTWSRQTREGRHCTVSCPRSSP